MRLTKSAQLLLLCTAVCRCASLTPLASHSNVTNSNSLAALPLVDVFIFNSEEEMLRYRIRLHSRVFSRFVVVESNITFSGNFKRLHAHDAVAKLERHHRSLDITILQIPLAPAQPAESQHKVRAAFSRETQQRVFLNAYILEHFPRHTIFFSDVDELLDPRTLASELTTNPTSDCITTSLRPFYYGESCQYMRRWDFGVVLRSDGQTFAKIVRAGAELRKSQVVSRSCPTTKHFVGWHFSYAMDTESIAQKLRDFSHASDMRVGVPKILALSQHKGALHQYIEDKVMHCRDLFGRTGEVSLQLRAHDGVLPPVLGWPRHPLAPSSLYSLCSPWNDTYRLIGAPLPTECTS